MEKKLLIRHSILFILLLGGIIWTLASSQSEARTGTYPHGDFLATGDWLRQHIDDDNLIVVDVRSAEDLKKDGGKLIPNAVHMPWGKFRYNDKARGIAETFVGLETAQKILGEHGIARNSRIVLYDSVRSDGGATASYLFFVLDLLGHKEIRLLDRGIDGWISAGGSLADQAAKPEPLTYQAPTDEIVLKRWAAEPFIYDRLGDSQYQIIDVRSREEYLGQKPNTGLSGNVLKLGHIPTAFNVDYRLNWVDSKSKGIKDYNQLLELYRGLDPEKPVIVYCHSGRRSSFAYFILRLMGFNEVIEYDNSWNGWGLHDFYYPAETTENDIAGNWLPTVGGKRKISRTAANQGRQTRTLEEPKGGYVSCGG